jgi:CRP/FNR family transcriptional regulator, cyclic AMP receptor protein
MDPRLIELFGYTAAGLVLATFSVRSMIALRTLAIASNLMFMVYAFSAHLLPVLALHARNRSASGVM